MWGQLITSVLMTVAGKVIAALGLSFISYVGLNEIQGYLLSHVQAQIGGLPSDAMNLAYIAGIGVCLNWIFGTFAFVTSLKSLSKLSTAIGRK
jgi:putative membrane protein